MDISKYIGLYLVKNNYCSLPGLGTLHLHKTVAVKQTNGEIIPASTSISFKNVGSIDDHFPHFIALNENISTNNASNAISNFGRDVKGVIQNNNSFEIDGLGKFYNNAGKVDFKANHDLDLGAFVLMPPVNNVESEEVVNNANATETEAKTINYNYTKALDETDSKMPSPMQIGKILLPIGLLAIVAVGGYYGYKYLQQEKPETPKTTQSTNAKTTDTVSKTIKDTTIVNTANTPKDTSHTVTTTETAPTNGTVVKVAILTFNNEASAKIKSDKLAKNGNNASVVKADSNNYNVVISVPASTKPVDKVVDSLRKFFNPSGKVFEVK